MRLPYRLQQVAQLRFRISVQMYAAIIGALAVTLAASLVGWISFNRVSDAQQRLVEGSIPELGAAFRITEYSSTLASIAPRFVTSTTLEELQAVDAEMDAAKRGFEEQMVLLRQFTGNPVFEQIRTNAQTVLNSLLANIHFIYHTVPALFELDDNVVRLRTEIIDLRTRLDDIMVPEIDDQIFYLLTGYQILGQPPVDRDSYLSETEFDHYWHLARLRAEATFATQLLSSAFNVSDAAFIEPLEESFESAEGHLMVSMASLGDPSITYRMEPIVSRLFEMGTNDDDGFDLLKQKHNLEAEQQALLQQNGELARQLLSGVTVLVELSEIAADHANTASSQALQTGRRLLLVISGIGIIGALLISWGFVGRVLVRRIGKLSERMQTMAEGDLEGGVEIEGRDEIADMAAALEIFRRHALEVQRLNLVEKLAEELGDKNSQLEEVLEELHRAQDQIVMREKLVALGEVTAGVAHEIRNPLNFVKNFSEASQELIEELEEILEESEDLFSEDDREYIEEIIQDLNDNLERVMKHCERANRIVHDMLMMGRGGGEWRPVELNLLLDEHALLAYHSARATDIEFQLNLLRDLDPEMGEIEAIPQDLGRTFLNMVGNSCYATDQKRKLLEEAGQVGDPFMPIVKLTTRRYPDKAVVSIYDNGTGMPDHIKEKVFNPFFTTKPTYEGTGLGLALSNDIIREHGGTIQVETAEGEFTEMIIELPLTKPDVVSDDEHF